MRILAEEDPSLAFDAVRADVQELDALFNRIDPNPPGVFPKDAERRPADERRSSERRQIDVELDLRACHQALWIATWSAERAGARDLQTEITVLWARCAARLRSLEDA